MFRSHQYMGLFTLLRWEPVLAQSTPRVSGPNILLKIQQQLSFADRDITLQRRHEGGAIYHHRFMS